MNVGSLFSGIGGFDLGFERAGMRVAWQVEQDAYCRAVLARHFPDAVRFEDVREVGARELDPVDLICGGFPCQDLSSAGRGAGIDGARSGLWSEFARIVRELRPRYVVVENVPALTRNEWLGRVLGDFAACGYDAEWDCIPASALGAPHRRDRIWLVAYPGGEGRRLQPVGFGGGSGPPESQDDGAQGSLADSPRDAQAGPASAAGSERERVGSGGQRSGAGELADADERGRQGRSGDFAEANGRGEPEDGGGEGGDVANPSRRQSGPVSTSVPGSGQRQVPREESGRGPRGPGGGGGTPGEHHWSVEPDVGRVADGVPSRVDRLSALGNALIPQIAEWIGRRILEYEREAVS